MKKIILGTLMVSLVIFLVGSGTFAYFSDSVDTNANSFNAGTFSMNLTDSDQAELNTVQATWKSPTNWVPGDTFTASITVKNDGNATIPSMGIDWHNLQGYAPFADKIEVVGWREYVPAQGWLDELGTAQHYQTLVGDMVAPLTLKELVQSYQAGEGGSAPVVGFVQDEYGNYVSHRTDSLNGMNYDMITGPVLPVGSYYVLEMTFKFSPTADNDFQGKQIQFDASFMGVQDVTQLP